MAYNNGFPMNYQQAYPQYNFAPQLPAQNNGIIWVQGEAGAKSYLVAPNNTVQLWDSENPVIYLKSADASGMPSMKIIDYTIRGGSQQAQPAVNDSYATKDELNGIKEELARIKSELRELRIDE